MNKLLVLVIFACLPLLVISSCSDDKTSSGMDSNSVVHEKKARKNYEAYVDKYPDLIAQWNSYKGRKSKKSWGKWHYKKHGKKEGRTVPRGSTTTTTTTSSCNVYEAYVDKYPDLLALWNSYKGRKSKSSWGKWHYKKRGKKKEGRTLPSCDSSGDSDDGWPSGDYSYLYQKNAHAFGGRTVRWASRTINVSGVSNSNLVSAVRRWPGFGFNFGPTDGIKFMGYSTTYPDACGWAQTVWWSNGEIAYCTIYINYWINYMNCKNEGHTMTHEVGHCLGMQGHSSDGGLMDPTAAGSSEITSPVQNFFNLLYALPPGTDITPRLSSQKSRARKKDQYDPDGKELIRGPIMFNWEEQ